MLIAKLKSLLIATLIFPLAFGGVFGVERTGASPPLLTSDTNYSLRFSDTTLNTINAINVAESGGITVTFSGKISSITLSDFDSTPETKSGEIYGYSLIGTNSTCKISTSGGIEREVPPVLIVSKGSGIYYSAGVYVRNPETTKYASTKDQMGPGHMCSYLNDLYKPAINTINNAPDGMMIYTAINSDDTKKICGDIQTKWGNIKSNMRLLLIPNSDSDGPNPTYWKDIGSSGEADVIAGGTLLTATSLITGLLNPVAGITMAILGSTIWRIASWDTGSTIQYALTDSGLAIVEDINNDATAIQQYLNQFKSAGKGDEWPCGESVKIYKFKWDKQLEDDPKNQIKTVNQFSSLIDNVIKQLDSYTKILSTPSTAGDEGDGCNFMKSIAGGNILPVMLCLASQFTHNIAKWLTEKATGYLKASIGIDISDSSSTPAPATKDDEKKAEGTTPAP